MGEAENITVNKVVSNKSDVVIRLDAPIKDCWINNIEQRKNTTTPILKTEELYAEENVKKTNIRFNLVT
ncbi:hypothetical protein I5549_07395 [Acinetobacter baumannii]|nr:hypothetical protein [Acinetobacter baumannii]MBJ9416541.1 hypothetical protein [Acinetobacter baumannii]